jgi:hypothetical protein
MKDFIIIKDYNIDNVKIYIAYAILFSLIVRIILSIFRSLEITSENNNNNTFFFNFWLRFSGRDKDPEKADYWLPFLIGFLELLVFPFLIKSGLWAGIAFWIGLKTAAQWQAWKDKRQVFNRFLLGSTIIIILSFTVMSRYVNIELEKKHKVENTTPNTP